MEHLAAKEQDVSLRNRWQMNPKPKRTVDIGQTLARLPKTRLQMNAALCLHCLCSFVLVTPDNSQKTLSQCSSKGLFLGPRKTINEVCGLSGVSGEVISQKTLLSLNVIFSQSSEFHKLDSIHPDCSGTEAEISEANISKCERIKAEPCSWLDTGRGT